MDLTAPRAASYWAPMFVFGVFTTLESYAPAGWYPWMYLLKVVAVVGTLVYLPTCLADIRPSARMVLPGVLVGLVIFAEWILLDRYVPYPHLGERVAFNPFEQIPDRLSLVTMLVTRFFGLVVMVPIIEETFWRNFVLRWVTNQDFEQVPVGHYSMAAFWVAAVGSALSHPEWLVALVAGVLFASLLGRTRSLFAVIVSHATANLALGIYILTTGDWKYW